MSRTPPPDPAVLAAALRACASGFRPAEAAVDLLIRSASWLHRDDFRDGYVHAGTSGTTLMAAIDWPAAIAALDRGGLPASGGERRVPRLAASLADGIPRGSPRRLHRHGRQQRRQGRPGDAARRGPPLARIVLTQHRRHQRDIY